MTVKMFFHPTQERIGTGPTKIKSTLTAREFAWSLAYLGGLPSTNELCREVLPAMGYRISGRHVE